MKKEDVNNKKEQMWIKVCKSCGYKVWAISYNTKCSKCGGQATCEEI